MAICSICKLEKPKCTHVTLHSAYLVGHDTQFIVTGRIDITTYHGFLQHDFQVCSKCIGKGCLPVLAISAVSGIAAGLFMWLANGFKMSEWYAVALIFLSVFVVLSLIGMLLVNKFFGYRSKLNQFIYAERGKDIAIFDAVQYSRLKQPRL